MINLELPLVQEVQNHTRAWWYNHCSFSEFSCSIRLNCVTTELGIKLIWSVFNPKNEVFVILWKVKLSLTLILFKLFLFILYYFIWAEKYKAVFLFRLQLVFKIDAFILDDTY